MLRKWCALVTATALVNVRQHGAICPHSCFCSRGSRSSATKPRGCFDVARISHPLNCAIRCPPQFSSWWIALAVIFRKRLDTDSTSVSVASLHFTWSAVRPTRDAILMAQTGAGRPRRFCQETIAPFSCVLRESSGRDGSQSIAYRSPSKRC